MVTYEIFQSSTKIITKENLVYVGENFITVHTAVIKQICNTRVNTLNITNSNTKNEVSSTSI
jgi:hypothetical protein